MFHHVINYQHVSVAFAVIGVSVIGVDLQGYKDMEYQECIKH
jgi:hypothetical protein